MRGRLWSAAGILAGVCGMSGLANADGYGPVGYAQPWSWAGFYIGVNAGADWENASFTSTSVLCPASHPGCTGIGHLGGVPAAAGTGSNTNAGFAGGGQLGF